MKRLFTILLFISATGHAQSKQIVVPDAVKPAFNAKFPTATNITWGREGAKEYEAEFNMGDAAIAANFKVDGTWVVTETTVPIAVLPEKINKAVTDKFSNGIITRVEKVEKPGSKFYYELIVINDGKKKEVLINEDGSFIK